MRFAKVISLGTACDAAFHIRRHFGQEEAYPFDWLVTPFDALLHLIETGFEGFLDPAMLQARTKDVRCRRSGIRFLHDWHDLADPMAEYPAIKAKYDRRIARFLAAMEQGGSVLFIRSCKAGPTQLMDPARAIRLQAALARAYPKVAASLVALNPEDAGIPAWSEGPCRLVTLRQPALPDWRGDADAWDAFFATLPR